MKWVLNILGALLLLSGIVWILQGAGFYPVGLMAHQIKYAYAGIVVIIIAIGFLVIANRRRKNTPPSPKSGLSK
jgi:uncharacterized membrane protein SirB2